MTKSHIRNKIIALVFKLYKGMEDVYLTFAFERFDTGPGR